MPIRPGNFRLSQTDYTDYSGSMAAAIDSELNALLLLDGMPGLNQDDSDSEVRARRRLFVAIARGVVRHLNERETSIDIALPNGTIVHPDLQVEGL